jgi:hypothetical protein
MKELFEFRRCAMMFAAVAFAALSAVSCGDKEEPQEKRLPADAGVISGPTEIENGGSIDISIAAIENATTYKWYKDGSQVQNTESRTMKVTSAGLYKVAGVNADGEGKASADHVVTLAIVELPAAAGNIYGAAKVVEGQSIELEIDEIERAETYRWYKGGVEVQNTEDRFLTVTEAGEYTVAGVNAGGEGQPSPSHKVALVSIPGDPGAISGPTELMTNLAAVLTIGTMDGVKTYKWYKDAEVVQNDTSPTLRITSAGVYKVSGVNEAGEGATSPEHTVVEIPNTLPPDMPTSILLNGVEYYHANPVTGITFPCEAVISEVPLATSYRWRKMGSQVPYPILQDSESRTYIFTEPGNYSIASVNENGECQPWPFNIYLLR